LWSTLIAGWTFNIVEHCTPRFLEIQLLCWLLCCQQLSSLRIFKQAVPISSSSKKKVAACISNILPKHTMAPSTIWPTFLVAHSTHQLNETIHSRVGEHNTLHCRIISHHSGNNVLYICTYVNAMRWSRDSNHCNYLTYIYLFIEHYTQQSSLNGMHSQYSVSIPQGVIPTQGV